MKNFIIPLLVLSLISIACCKKLPPGFKVELNDTAGNNVLANAETTDSTWKWLAGQDDIPYPISILNSDNGGHLSLRSLTSGKDYYIMVDSSDIDTVNFIYEVKGFNCNVDTKVEHFFYNGVKFEGGKKGATLRAIKY